MKGREVLNLFRSNLKVINVGLKDFYLNLKKLGSPAVHVDWRPPARGKKKNLELLEKLKKFA